MFYPVNENALDKFYNKVTIIGNKIIREITEKLRYLSVSKNTVKYINVENSHKNVLLENNNLCINVSFIHCECEFNFTPTGTEPIKECNFFVISVGDILKFYYHQVYKASNVNSVFSTDEERNESLLKMLKKSLQKESSSHDSKNVLGLITINSFNLWNDLNISSACTKNETFELYCKKVMYINCFDEYVKLDTLTIYNKLYNIFNTKLIVRLLEYFMYNTDPNESHYKDRVFYFDPPESVPNVLLQIYKETEQERYMTMYRQVTVKLNKRLSLLLDDKYKPYIVNSLSCLKNIKKFPTFALRNIYVRQWSITKARNFWGTVDSITSDICIAENTENFFKITSCEKYKNKTHKSDKTVYWNWNFVNYKSRIKLLYKKKQSNKGSIISNNDSSSRHCISKNYFKQNKEPTDIYQGFYANIDTSEFD